MGFKDGYVSVRYDPGCTHPSANAVTVSMTVTATGGVTWGAVFEADAISGEPQVALNYYDPVTRNLISIYRPIVAGKQIDGLGRHLPEARLLRRITVDLEAHVARAEETQNR